MIKLLWYYKGYLLTNSSWKIWNLSEYCYLSYDLAAMRCSVKLPAFLFFSFFISVWLVFPIDIHKRCTFLAFASTPMLFSILTYLFVLFICFLLFGCNGITWKNREGRGNFYKIHILIKLQCLIETVESFMHIFRFECSGQVFGSPKEPLQVFDWTTLYDLWFSIKISIDWFEKGR